ncbi:MAG TPA: hypothetical protein VF247_03770 [Candidatus Krumholzibacteria bacterium]
MAPYVELIVRGDDRAMKAFVAGYFAGSAPARVVFADDAGFHLHGLRERITHHGEVQHLFVEQANADRVRAALASATPHHRFEIKEERAASTARFRFDFDTPSREVAGKIKATLAALPAGATLGDYNPRERTEKGASGAELYSPEHDFRFDGRGVLRGDLFAVVDARAALSAIDFVRCDEIEVDRP